MTGLVPASPPGQPSRADLTALIFRALYQGFDLHTVGVLYVVVLKGTCCFAGPSLGEIARQISTRPRPFPPRPAPAGRHEHMTSLPAPADAARLTRFLRCHPRWSVFWDKKYGVWRVAEDDPDSSLYAENSDVDTVISYITAHS